MQTIGTAPLDWSQCPGVARIPGKVGGAWLFKGTRTPVSLVLQSLEAGMTAGEIIEQYPITREQINTVLEFVALSVAAAQPSRTKTPAL